MAKAHILNELLPKLGMNISTFEKKIDIGSSTIHKAIQRDSDLKMDTIQKIIDTFPQINKAWLQTGEGDMFIKDGVAAPAIKEEAMDNTINNDWKLAHERLLDAHKQYAQSHEVLSNALSKMVDLLGELKEVKANLNDAAKKQQNFRAMSSANQRVALETMALQQGLSKDALVKNARNLGFSLMALNQEVDNFDNQDNSGK